MNLFKTAAIAFSLTCLALPASAAIITEATDFSGSISSAVSNPIGDFGIGLTTVSGSISSQCGPNQSSVIVCNNVGDFQDSFGFTIAGTLQIVGLSIEVTNFNGPDGSSAAFNSFSLDSLGVDGSLINGFIPSTGGIILSQDGGPSFAGRYPSLGSFFVFNALVSTFAQESGPLSYDYTIGFDVAAIDTVSEVPAPGALALMLTGLAGLGWMRRRKVSA